MEYYRNVQFCPVLEEPAVRIQKEGQELEAMRMIGETGNRRRLGLGVQR